jgi:hypothetical protein
MKTLLVGVSLFSAHRALVRAINEAAVVKAIGAINELGERDWIRITPFGEFPNKVGLQVVDRASGEAMVSAFNAVSTKLATLWRGLPIYEGHPDDPEWRRANPGVRTVAVGRVKELQLRDDGVCGRVAFNELGTPLVRGEAPAYDAQSPHWGMSPLPQRKKTFRPMELNSLGLTNHPNIPGTELGLNEDSQLSALDSQLPNYAMKKHIIALLAALGRPVANADTVTDDQLAAAVNEAVPVATAAITAVNELATVKPQLTAATNQVQSLTTQLTAANGLVKAANEARVDLVLTSAINEGRITQAQRAEWAGKFSAQGADFAAVEGELKKLTKAVNTKSKVSGLGERKAEELAAGDKIRAVNEAIAAKKQAAPALSHAEAFAAVKREKPELFANDTSE